MLKPMLNRKVPVKIVKVKLHKDVKHFSVWHLLTFGLVFAIIGGYIIYHSFAAEQSTLATNIDYTSQSAVNTAYWNLWAPAQSTKPGWTGAIKGCVAGNMSDTARSAEVDAINFVRRLQQLKPITAGNGVANSVAMRTALMMDANGVPDHTPQPGFPCYTREGADAAGKSNLAVQFLLSSPVATPVGEFVKGYLSEPIPPAENKVLGHRRRLSFPDANVFGVGTTNHASAIQVIGLSTSVANPSPDVVWPSRGYFPKQLAPHIWSLTGAVATADFSAATVKVTHNGNVVQGINKYVTDPRYGPLPTLAWEMPFQYDKSGAYNVAVNNIRGDGKTSISYTVRLFDPVQ